MLYYEKRLLGLPLLLRGVGSVLPRAVFPALVAAGLSLVFELTVPHEVLAELFVHPYPFQVFAYIVAFALVFRTNVGYNRYWEGRTQAAQMLGAKPGRKGCAAVRIIENTANSGAHHRKHISYGCTSLKNE